MPAIGACLLFFLKEALLRCIHFVIQPPDKDTSVGSFNNFGRRLSYCFLSVFFACVLTYFVVNSRCRVSAFRYGRYFIITQYNLLASSDNIDFQP